ncbi:hypothetical protein JOE65_000825 [Arthrobacter roseus]|nr:hypothetical protein [Arthrobacter roseus]
MGNEKAADLFVQAQVSISLFLSASHNQGSLAATVSRKIGSRNSWFAGVSTEMRHPNHPRGAPKPVPSRRHLRSSSSLLPCDRDYERKVGVPLLTPLNRI